MVRRDALRVLSAALATVAMPAHASSGLFSRTGQREVAGITIPDTELAVKAARLAQEAYDPSLFNHCARTYVFAGLMGAKLKMKIDLELLFLASILHDLGLTERYMGSGRFEARGADVAGEFLTSQGLTADRTAIVCDAILMHSTGFIAERKRPEVALVSIATGTDVVGDRLSEYTRQQVEDILTAFPRLNFKKAFVRDCVAVIGRHPDSAGGFMKDVAARHVPAVKFPNICDAIEAASFPE